MTEEFFKSTQAIREESIGMIKTLRAVRGENYARLVHSIILADQIENVTNIFVESTTPETRELAQGISKAQMSMVAQIMTYYTRCTQFSKEQIAEAIADADRIQRSTYDLISKADDLSKAGKVMGE